MDAKSLQSRPTFCNPIDCSLPGSSDHGDSPDKNTGVGCHALLQGIFPAAGLNPGLLHCREILYHLSYQGSPTRDRVESQVSCPLYSQAQKCTHPDFMQPVLGRPDPGTPVSSSQRRLWKEDQLFIRRFQVQARVVCSRRRGGGHSLDGHNLLALWTPYTIGWTNYIIWRTKYKMKMQDPLFKQKK